MHMSDHLKQQIKAKMQERDRLEATIQDCSARLEATGVGLQDKLVDGEVKLGSCLIVVASYAATHIEDLNDAGLPSRGH